MSMLLWVSGCALWKLSSVGKSQAELAGEWRTDGIEGEVRLVRDRYGVPHVRAGSEREAWFGLGFAHAQDRLFQADLSRRTASGRLSEWFGAGAADVDAFGRALGLPELAAARLAAASPETRGMLESYAAGMNAGAASLPALPIEYRLLEVPFEPWTPEDCFGVGFLLAWTLEDNLSFELAALELRDQPPAVLDALLRIDPESPPIDPYWDTLRTVDPGKWSDPFAAWIDLLGGGPDKAEASNNWVVGGELSASGKPIVCRACPGSSSAMTSGWRGGSRTSWPTRPTWSYSSARVSAATCSPARPGSSSGARSRSR
jgi:penicillin G amidase